MGKRILLSLFSNEGFAITLISFMKEEEGKKKKGGDQGLRERQRETEIRSKRQLAVGFQQRSFTKKFIGLSRMYLDILVIQIHQVTRQIESYGFRVFVFNFPLDPRDFLRVRFSIFYRLFMIFGGISSNFMKGEEVELIFEQIN